MPGYNPFDWLMEKWPEENYKIIAMILDSIYDGVLIADEKSIVRYVNPEYTRITGVSSEAIVGHRVTELRPGAVLPTVIKTGKNSREFIGGKGRSNMSSTWRRLSCQGRSSAAYRSSRT